MLSHVRSELKARATPARCALRQPLCAPLTAVPGTPAQASGTLPPLRVRFTDGVAAEVIPRLQVRLPGAAVRFNAVRHSGLVTRGCKSRAAAQAIVTRFGGEVVATDAADATHVVSAPTASPPPGAPAQEHFRVVEARRCARVARGVTRTLLR